MLPWPLLPSGAARAWLCHWPHLFSHVLRPLALALILESTPPPTFPVSSWGFRPHALSLHLCTTDFSAFRWITHHLLQEAFLFYQKNPPSLFFSITLPWSVAFWVLSLISVFIYFHLYCSPCWNRSPMHAGTLCCLQYWNQALGLWRRTNNFPCTLLNPRLFTLKQKTD